MNKYDTIYTILLSVNIIVALFPAKLGKLSTPLAIMTGIFVSVIVREIFADIVFGSYVNNLFIYHFHNPVEYSLYVLFFYQVMKGAIRKYLLASIPFYIVFSLSCSFFVQQFQTNNNYQVIVESIIIILLALKYITQLLENDVDKPFEKLMLFWISAAIVVNFVGTLYTEGFLEGLGKVAASDIYRIGFLFKYAMCIMCIAACMKRPPNQQNT